MIRSFCDCDRDTYGFCPIHDLRAIVCACCRQVIRHGVGIAPFEGGDNGAVTYGLCAACKATVPR